MSMNDWGFKDLRSPEAKAADEARRLAENKKLDRLASKLTRARNAMWCDHNLWSPIEGCPFDALAQTYGGYGGRIIVTDGTNTAIATVSKRFGRPLCVINQPQMAITDDGVAYVGGEYAEIEAPKWWFKWQLTDDDGGENYAGGEPIGRDDVDFIPTHFMLLPPASR